jgi:hypothetical protein
MPTIEEYAAWKADLGTLDLMNYEMLLALPKADSIIDKAPDGEFKRMAKAGLLLTKATRK